LSLTTEIAVEINVRDTDEPKTGQKQITVECMMKTGWSQCGLQSGTDK